MPRTEVNPPSTAPVRAKLQQMRRASAGFCQHASEPKAPAAYAATLSAKPVLTESIFIGPVHHSWMKGLLSSSAPPILCGPYFPSLICNAIRFLFPVLGVGTRCCRAPPAIHRYFFGPRWPSWYLLRHLRVHDLSPIESVRHAVADVLLAHMLVKFSVMHSHLWLLSRST